MEHVEQVEYGADMQHMEQMKLSKISVAYISDHWHKKKEDYVTKRRRGYNRDEKDHRHLHSYFVENGADRALSLT